MRKYLLLLNFLVPLMTFAGINPPYVNDWEGTTNVGWTSIQGVYNVTTDAPCQGNNSIRVRLQSNSSLGTSILRSPSLGTTDGGVITFSYDYKWLMNNGNVIGNPVPAQADRLSVKWQWSNSANGPWYTFDIVDGSNHIESITCATRTATFTAYPGSLFVRVIGLNTSINGDNYLYFDNINIVESAVPTCGMPVNLRVGSKTNTSFNIFWQSPTGSNVQEYEWEVRRTGSPGTPGRVDGGVTQNLNVSTTSPLLGSTNYQIFVRAKCSSTEFSSWIGIEDITFCTPPVFNTTKQTINICGIQPLEITTNCGGTSYWFDEDNQLVTSGANAKIDIPAVDKNYNYKVYCGGNVSPNNPMQINIGQGVASSTDAVPFSATKANKGQYIYTAEELRTAGFNSGIIRSFGFRVGSTIGTAQRNNFTIHMGLTPLEEFSNTNFIPTDYLTLVKNPGNQLLVVNEINMFELDTPFMWDGVSNIVVQIAYSDLIPTFTATSAISTSFQSSNSYRSLVTQSTTNDLNAMYAMASGARNYIRMNGFFDILDGCFTEIKEIEVVYTPAPDLILSTNRVNNCVGGTNETLYILSGHNLYDVYEWGPNDPNDPNNPNNANNAITGSAATGWQFNPTQNTIYTLKASSSTGNRCVITQDVVVEINPQPVLLPLQNDYSICIGDVQELKVFNNLDEKPFTYLFNGNLNGVTLNSTVPSDAIGNNNTLYSEGNGSLLMSYGNQTNASLIFDAAIDITHLKTVEVSFDHIAALQSSGNNVFDYGYLEYSLDNGVTWSAFLPTHYSGSANTNLNRPVGNTNLQAMFFTSTSYSDWNNITQSSVPNNTSWKSEKFMVPESVFVKSGILKIRFKIGSDGNTQFPGWLIDNVKITPVSRYEIDWSPWSNLYYDQNATLPYDGTRNVGVVYAKGNNNSLNVPYVVDVVSDKGCQTSRAFTMSIGLKENPVVNDITNCGPIDVSSINFGKNVNGTLFFYNSQTSNLSINQITTSGVYYVEQEISRCKSARIPFNVIISPIATVPVVIQNQTFCGAATISDLVYNPVQGLQIKWYYTLNGGIALNSTTPINNGVYYAEFTNGNCTSDYRVAVNVTVNIQPPALSLSDVYICGSSTINDIKVNSLPTAIVKWYQNSTDTNALANNTVLTNGVYYVAQVVNGCESLKVPVNINIIPTLPLATAVSTQVFCGSATVQDLVANSTNPAAEIFWYGFGSSDTPLSPNTPLTSGTYYVGQSIGDCDSPKRAVSVRILTTNAPTINPISTCGDTTVATLPLTTSSTLGYKVYTSMWITTEMGQNDPIYTGVYYISKVENGCETQRTPVQITVNARPNAPTGNILQTFQDYAEIKDLVTNETNVVWFESYNDAVNNVNPLHSTHALVNDRVYYGVIIGGGNCASLPFEVTVKIILGVNELDLASLKYYPNPVENEINVSYKDVISGLEVYDLSGKLVRKQSFEANDVKLDTSNLSAGTYMIKVLTNKGSQFIKIVKK